MTPLVDFLEGRAPNIEGRTIDEILEASDRWIEDDHSFIQWLFPTVTVSRYNPSAPVLTAEEATFIGDSSRARSNLKRALERMKRFYGTNTHWLVRGDHNHLRISRIIECTTLLAGRAAAEDFLEYILACSERQDVEPPAGALRAWRGKLRSRFKDAD